MRLEKILGILILCDVVLAVSGVVTDYALEPLLPAPLRAFVAADGGAPFGSGAMALTGVWVVVLASSVLAWAGLLSLLRAARPLYLASWGAYLVLLLLSGPIVTTPAAYVVQMLMALVGGAIAGLIYFSDLRTSFRGLSSLAGTPVGKAA